MIATERLYLTADRRHVVHEGDKRAAFLLAAKGQEISPVIVRRYGLDNGGAKEKRGRKPADKMVRKPGDKGADADDEPRVGFAEKE